MKIAVIGSGISGLSAAYYLSQKHSVDIFEKEDHFGGHSNTINIFYDKEKQKQVAVDIGFIVFNEKNYPDLVSFFNYLDVKTSNSNKAYNDAKNNIYPKEQLQHLLMITGLEKIDYWCYLKNKESILIPVRRDQKMINQLYHRYINSNVFKNEL